MWCLSKRAPMKVLTATEGYFRETCCVMAVKAIYWSVRSTQMAQETVQLTTLKMQQSCAMVGYNFIIITIIIIQIYISSALYIKSQCSLLILCACALCVLSSKYVHARLQICAMNHCYCESLQCCTGGMCFYFIQLKYILLSICAE